MFTVFHKAQEVWEAQLEDIKNATQQIYLEQYILKDFGEGEIGARYMEVLIRKAQEGVDVELVIDFQGSYTLFLSSALNEAFKKAGGKIFYYKTLGLSRLINPARVLLRDHRKLLMVDKNITWIGGVVIGEQYRTWNDFMVRYDDTAVTRVLNKEFKSQIARLEDRRSLLAPVEYISEDAHLIGNAPGIGNRFCYDEVCHAIMLARKNVTMVSPYFVPPLKLLRVLSRRLTDGLEIVLLVPRQTDSTIADYVREEYITQLIKKGLILNYAPSMNHSKMVFVDDTWLTFGSMNLDPTSLVFNHELNITTANPELISEAKGVVAAWRKGLEQIEEGCCEYDKYPLVRKIVLRIIRYIISLVSN